MAKTTNLQTNNPNQADDQPDLLFDNSNYMIVLVGIVFIAVGFAMMAGGGSPDPNVFDADAIYSTRRITIAPIFVIIGFIIEFFAILKKP